MTALANGWRVATVTDREVCSSEHELADRLCGRPAEPLAFLAALRNLHPDLPRYGENGGCFRVHLALKAVFPGAVPLYDGNHVVTRIDGKLYDISGEVDPASGLGHSYIPMEDWQLESAHDWTGYPVMAEVANG
jgi:hypothetical protein